MPQPPTNIPEERRGKSPNKLPGKDDIGWIYSLKKKMLIGVLSLLVVLTVTSLVLIAGVTRKKLMEETAKNAQELGDTIKSSLRILMLKRDPRMIQDTLDDIGKNKDPIVKAFILDKAGRIVYSTEKKEIGRMLNRFEEKSCRVCHRETGKAPAETIMILNDNGVKIQRNIDVIYNEPVCHQCHAPSDRIRGKLVIDHSLSRANTLISSLELIIISSGVLCLLIIVPFVLRQVNLYIAELQKALAEIKTLHGILPICSVCKKIRDDKGSWEQMEVYIKTHSEADFSHGYCPECAKKVLMEIEAFKKSHNKE